MLFTFIINTTKNTAESDAVSQILTLTNGVLDKIIVFFPDGSDGDLRFRLSRGTIPIAPKNAHSYIAGNAVKLDWEEFIFLNQPPFALEIESWNLDVNYDHKLFLYISVNPLFKHNPFSAQLLKWEQEEELAGLNIETTD